MDFILRSFCISKSDLVSVNLLYCLQLPSGLEENLTGSVSRPEFPGQHLYRHHPLGHAETLLLQRKLW